MKRTAGSPGCAPAAALIATAALALLAAACSGSPSSAGPGGPPQAGGSSAAPSAVAYSACMRSHGVPNFPDPGSNGQVPKADPQQLGVSSSQLLAAQRTCQHLYPANGGALTANSLRQCYESYVCPQALVQQALNAGLKFARCMRSRGVANWPDPITDSQGRPLFDIAVPGGAGFATGRGLPASPPVAQGTQINTKINECARLYPEGALLAWG